MVEIAAVWVIVGAGLLLMGRSLLGTLTGSKGKAGCSGCPGACSRGPCPAPGQPALGPTGPHTHNRVESNGSSGL